jgi:hypothetical protein
MKKYQGKIIIVLLGIISVCFIFNMFYNHKGDFDIITVSFLVIIGFIYWIGIIISFIQQQIIDNERYNNNNTVESQLIDKLKIIASTNYLNYFNAVDSYHILYDKMMKRYFSVISSLSSILITLGLIGTVFGLIVSMGGLKELVLSSGDNAGILSTMTNVLSGVDIAFYTTLFGSFLGGILLRMCLIINGHNANIVSNNVKMKWLNTIELPVSEKIDYHEIEEMKEILSSFNKLHSELSVQVNNTNTALSKFEQALHNISRIPIHKQLAAISYKIEDNTNYFRKVIDVLTKK